MERRKDILYCTDFSENAEYAFREACYMRSLTGGRLVVFHAVSGGVGEAALGVLPAQRHAEAVEHLKRLRGLYATKACSEMELVVRTGDVTTQILDLADEMQAGMIVIGARGVGRLEGFLGGGSIAERIIRTSKVPVLVVTGEAHLPKSTRA
jgi:nucleotide-binding universal stress UspA family protein